MTLPTLIQNHRTNALEAGFKKSYANLQNAYNLTKESLGGVNIYSTYTKYEYGKGFYNAGIFYNEFYKNMRIVGTVAFYPITNYTNTKVTNTNIGNDMPNALYVLSDGSSVGIVINGGVIKIFIDSNGPYKGPNRYGFDIFQFRVQDSTDAIKPIRQTRKYSEEELSSMSNSYMQGVPCNKDSTQAANGMGCSYYAVNDINPEDNSKGYWKNLPW